MYTLLGAPGAASWVVHWLLIELQVPHEFRHVDLAAKAHKTPEFLKLNPSGVVPVLLIDGEPMCEAAAIALLLAERHPEGELAPPVGSVGRVPYLQWMLYFANTLQPAFRAWFYPHEAAGSASEAAVATAARSRIEAAWQYLDDHLSARGPYLAGSAPSATDFHGVMLARWSRTMPKPATHWPAVAAWVARMKARPSFKLVNDSEGLTDWT